MKNKNIKAEINKAKESWIKKHCQEIEYLNSKHDTNNLYQKIHGITDNKKTRTTSITSDNRKQMQLEEKI